MATAKGKHHKRTNMAAYNKSLRDEAKAQKALATAKRREDAAARRLDKKRDKRNACVSRCNKAFNRGPYKYVSKLSKEEQRIRRKNAYERRKVRNFLYS